MGRAGPVSPGRGGHRWHAPRNGQCPFPTFGQKSPVSKETGDFQSKVSEFHTPSVSQRLVGKFYSPYGSHNPSGTSLAPGPARYAEREPATSREGPMVSFDHRPSGTNWLPALPGDRSGGFCSPCGSYNPPGTSLAPGPAGGQDSTKFVKKVK